MNGKTGRVEMGKKGRGKMIDGFEENIVFDHHKEAVIKHNTRVKLFFLFLVGVTLFFSFSPGNVTPSIISNNDKLAHFFVFFVLSVGLKISFSEFSVRKLFFIMVLLAAGIEVFQYLFASREPSFLDFLASILGVFIYLIILRLMRKSYNVARGENEAI